jgi:hypothetical protein
VSLLCVFVASGVFLVLTIIFGFIVAAGLNLIVIILKWRRFQNPNHLHR